MHIHASRINPNAEMMALYAAEKAAARKETDRVRKKLIGFGSVLSSVAEDEDDGIAMPGPREESQGHAKQQGQQDPRRPQKQGDGGASPSARRSFSHWV